MTEQQPVFVTPLANLPKRWQVAFPGASRYSSVTQCLGSGSESSVCLVEIECLKSHNDGDGVAALAAQTAGVIVLSSLPTEREALASILSGARGYCHASASPSQLVNVVLAVRSGGVWVPPGLLQRLVRSALIENIDSSDVQDIRVEALTAREQDVARAVAQGASNKEIALSLNITERTVKAHLTSIFEKLDVRDRVQLALAFSRQVN